LPASAAGADRLRFRDSETHGELLHSGQWNIDEKSMVRFAGMGFRIRAFLLPCAAIAAPAWAPANFFGFSPAERDDSNFRHR